MEIRPDAAEGAGPPPTAPAPAAEPDLEALERAASARLAEASASQAPSAAPAKYATTRSAAVSATPPQPNPQSESIFGGDLLSEKSLDEVILSYLAEDVDADG